MPSHAQEYLTVTGRSCLLHRNDWTISPHGLFACTQVTEKVINPNGRQQRFELSFGTLRAN